MSKIYYFVDYENVHEAGLEGMNRLPRESEVHLFYSQNANKLNLDLLRFVKAKLEVHRVKPGKQSLDMQMVSYLGYCIGEAGREGKFVLVSKDTDYANTVLFWQEEGVEVRVQPAIREEKNADGMERALKAVKVTRRGKRGGRKTSAAVQEAAPEEVKAEPAKAPVQTESSPAAAPAQPVKEEASAAAPAAVPAEPQAEGTAKEEKKTRRGRRGGRGRKAQAESAPAEAAEKPAEPTVKEAAPEKTDRTETKASAGKNGKPAAKKAAEPAAKAAEKKPEMPEDKPSPVQNKAVPSEPAKVTVTVHDVPMVTHAVAPAKPEKSVAVSRIQAALAESKTDAAVTRKVVSIVQKYEGAKNRRQATYLEIRKTFGQKMGVDLYNRIKPLLR